MGDDSISICILERCSKCVTSKRTVMYCRITFYAEIDTDNLTEAFNYALRSQYLQFRQDSSVTDLIEVLVNIVFPPAQSSNMNTQLQLLSKQMLTVNHDTISQIT